MINTMMALVLSSQLTLVLSPEAHVAGTEIRLGDVAELRGDAALVGELSQVSIGYSPSPGFNRLLRGWRLEQNLERDHPGLDVLLSGTPSCRVWPATTVVRAEVLEEAARALLLPALTSGSATAVLATELHDIEVPAGASEPVVRAGQSEIEIHAGTVMVPLRIDIDGAPYRTVMTQWNVEQWRVLPVLVRDVPAGTVIDFSMIENRRVKAARHGQAKPLPAGMAVGAVAARNLEAGAPVSERDVHRPKIIQQGDSIYISIRKGPVVARVSAVAVQDGALGERVRVKTQNSRELMAVVIGRDLVELDLTIGS